MKHKLVAFIPVRGGSKTIPLKNIKLFCGRPLVYWVIKASQECPHIEAIYVSTDSNKIKKTVEDFGFSKVKTVGRSKRSASDTAPTEAVMLEFSKNHDYEHIVLIQATSPLLERKDLDAGIQKYFGKKADSLLSVVREKKFLWQEHKDVICPINYDPLRRPRRQDWKGFLAENGAFYITSRKNLLSSKSRISGKTSFHEMRKETSCELDELSDWRIMEELKKELLIKNQSKGLDLRNINLLVCDVDGVLTDGGMFYSENGERFKKFNTKDGKGIELIRKMGIKVMFLTSENTDIVKRRAEKLNIDFVFMGVKEKLAFLKRFFKENRKYGFNRTAYVGDDLNDLECMKSALFSAAPQDALQEVKGAADYVCTLKGGKGCLREVCDLILRRK